MRILYPVNPLNPKEADGPFQDEFALLKAQGIDCSLFDFDVLATNEFKPKPPMLSGEQVLYRGWMFSATAYRQFVALIESRNGVPVTSCQNYVKCHHISKWYECCKDLTPESRFFPNDEPLMSNVAALGWDQYFVKDFVKSNSTERGSVAASVSEVLEIVDLIQLYRGQIEGGVAVRRVEKYRADSESRYFVFNGKAYSATGDVPDIVAKITQRIDAPFYSVDIAQRDDGIDRLIEIGDGQVSDKKTWHVDLFTEMLIENLR